MMRFLLFFSLVMLAGAGRAQQFFPSDVGYSSIYAHSATFPAADSAGNIPKWSLQKYSSLSAGLMIWKGGSASYLSAPVGLQLNRRITNNVFAFAGVSVVPSVVGFRQAFTNPDFKNAGLRGMNQSYGFGMYSRAELGLGYTNDARTFEIRGSISIQRSDFPFQPAFRKAGVNGGSSGFER